MTKQREKMTIAIEDVATIDAPSIGNARPRTLHFDELKIGMRVAFVDDTLNKFPRSHVPVPHESNEAIAGRVLLVVGLDAVTPGKTVGVYCKEPIPGGHSCDGRVPDGHGLYLLPDHLYTIAALTEHQRMAEHAVVEHRAIASMIEEFDAG
jgi:hypothetical protein